MDKENKKRLIVTLFGIISIVMLLAGMSYAAYSSDILGNEENVVKAGCLKIDMQDSGNLNITNAIPQKDEKGLQNEPYTYTLTNTCSVDATYITTLNVMDDTNLENISKMRIALSGDSNLEPTTQSELKEIESVDESETNIAKTYMIDEGTLAVGESKTFHLRSWVDYEVTEITGKVHNKVIVFSEALHNKTIAYSTKSAAYQTLKNMVVLSNNQYSYDAIDNQTGLIKVTEEKKVKYYLRGNPDNYIKFGTNANGENYTWRILSANEDGSINIILDSIYTSGAYDTIETNLNALYADLQKDEKYIKTDSTFCEEIDKEEIGYLAKLRVENHSPTSICKTENFLTKIGLPTADDLMYSGAVTGLANDSFYLASETDYFTQSHASSNTVYAYKTTDSIIETDKTTSLGIKPVITLSKDAIIEGEGTESETFYVTGLYTEEKPVNKDDNVAPEIIFARVDEEWSKENKTIRISAKDDVQGSGITGYIVKATSEKPSLTDTDWESSSAITYTTINKYANGTYYVFAKDASGNISEPKQVVIEKVDKVVPVCTIKINPNGEASSYKVLTIESSDPYINKNAYSWEHITSKEDVIRINQNGVYTAYIEDLAGNKGTCSATITTIIHENLDESGANVPKLSDSMVAVYYDETNSTWKKADEFNKDKNYQWYDYNNKMWANSITYDHTKVYNESVSAAGNTKLGTVSGATYTALGINFDGIDDYIDTGNAGYDFENKLTVGARFNIDKYKNEERYLVGNAQNGGFALEIFGDGRVCLNVYGTTAAKYVAACSSKSIELNKWYAAVGTYDGSTIKLYLSGQKTSTTLSDTMKKSTMAVLVGANPNNGYRSYHISGIISDAFVIKDVLPEEQILKYYTNNINYQENQNTLFYYNMTEYESRENGTSIPMDMISTMQVWIPRYKYKVWNYNDDGTVTSEPRKIEITFEKDTQTTGEIECTEAIVGTTGGKSETCKLKATNEICTDITCNKKTYTHPAFTFGTNELKGMWVGKFEVSSDVECTPTDSATVNQENTCNIDTIRPIIKPNQKAWTGAMMSVFSNNMMAMNDINNKYGFSSGDDTHVMKNDEWGAVAYLTHSKYGTCDNTGCKEVALNSANTLTTGCGPQSEGSTTYSEICNAYDTNLGKKASTTGNIYGIYDMSGGAWDSVMANVVSSNATTMMVGYRKSTNANSGYTGIIYYGSSSGDYAAFTGSYAYPNDKYYTKYSFGTSAETRERSRLGDAIKEVYIGSGKGWNNDTSYIARTAYPWGGRGGFYDSGAAGGIFYSNNGAGHSNIYRSSRLVISQ